MLIKLVTTLTIFFSLLVHTSNAEQKAHPTKASISTKEDAVEVAENILVKTYGKEVLKQRPFNASLSGDYWTVIGTFHCPQGSVCKGGVAQLQINKNDGKATNITHGK